MSNIQNTQPEFSSVLVGKKVVSIGGCGTISGITGFIVNYEDGYKTVSGGGGLSGEDVMWYCVFDSTDRLIEEY